MKNQCLLCRVQDCSLEKDEKVTNCSINKFLKVIGWKRWMVVLLVLEKPHRFWELKRSIPDITEKMLISTLKSLGKATYIKKHKTTGKKLASTYSITVLWSKVLNIAESMAEFGKLL